MRLAVYSDFAYRRSGRSLYTDQSFVRFLAELAPSVERLVLVGRLDPLPGRSHYRIPAEVAFAALPHYPSLSQPRAVARAVLRSITSFWRVLGSVDAVWLMGPHPLSLAFAGLAVARRKAVTLGVRQDFPAHMRSRHPRRPLLRLAALLLEGGYRLAARRLPVIVVGGDLAHRYRTAPRLLNISVSLVREAAVVREEIALQHRPGRPVQILSVGRLDAEKNPLLLAEILTALPGVHEGRWRLVICGEGSMATELAARLTSLDVAHHAVMRGYVPLDDGLVDVYRSSHAFLHVSWTEGMPQVLLEAFAAGLPVVATGVGGVSEMAGGSAIIVPPGDARAAASALVRLTEDSGLRGALIAAGLRQARCHTLEAESQRVVSFLRHPESA